MNQGGSFERHHFKEKRGQRKKETSFGNWVIKEKRSHGGGGAFQVLQEKKRNKKLGDTQPLQIPSSNNNKIKR